MKRLDDSEIIGSRFGRLIPLERGPMTAHGHSQFVCRCDCGAIKTVAWGRLRKGETQSCGCLQRELTAARSSVCNRTHGHKAGGKESRTYRAWINMHVRCRDPNHKSYKDYGGRGIFVCERWSSFDGFLADMGLAPRGRTLERVDNDGPYSPENCRWATTAEQAANRRLPARSRLTAEEERILYGAWKGWLLRDPRNGRWRLLDEPAPDHLTRERLMHRDWIDRQTGRITERGLKGWRQAKSERRSDGQEAG